MNRMYAEGTSLNAWWGCGFDCLYCKPSFQRQAKRRKPVIDKKGKARGCQLCYTYTPHFHKERLLRSPPRTLGDQFIFFPAYGDLAWASPEVMQAHIDYARKYRDRTFLIQSKDPKCFKGYDFPENVILATTIETNQLGWRNNPSEYTSYRDISQAPFPLERYQIMRELEHSRLIITAEPILAFNVIILKNWIREIEPEAVYVGYDNHKTLLPEPPLTLTLRLIREIEELGIQVRRKTLRKAWYES